MDSEDRPQHVGVSGCSIVHRPVGEAPIHCRKKSGHTDPCRGRDKNNKIVHWTLVGRTDAA